MIAHLRMLIYGFCLAIALMCGIASFYDFGGDRHAQAFGFRGLDGSGVFCGGRRLFLDGRSRGEIGLKAKK